LLGQNILHVLWEQWESFCAKQATLQFLSKGRIPIHLNNTLPIHNSAPIVKQDCKSVHAKARLQSPAYAVFYILKLTPIHTSISNGKCRKFNTEHVRTYEHN
jgi:hypothetical protein